VLALSRGKSFGLPEVHTEIRQGVSQCALAETKARRPFSVRPLQLFSRLRSRVLTYIHMYIHIYIHMYTYMFTHSASGRTRSPFCAPTTSPTVTWPLQDIRLLPSFLALVNHPVIAPLHLHCSHDCNTIARLMRNIRPPTRPFLCMPYNIQYWRWQYRVKAKAFTRYCYAQYCIVCGIKMGSRSGLEYCAIVLQSYCNCVGDAGG